MKRATVSNVIDLSYPASDSDEGYAYDDVSSLTKERFSDLCTAASDEEFEALYADMLTEARRSGLDDVNAYLTSTYADLCQQMGAQ